MNILITGANGLLGRNLVEFFSKTNKVYALIKNKEKISFKMNENIVLLELDLYDLNTEFLPKEIDAIYYLAQSNYFRDFPNSAKDMFEINIYSPLKLCAWAIENNVKKFIYASSGGVYTNPNKPVKEFFDINANEKQGFYLNSKLSAEILLKNYIDYFETFVIIRPFFMYGINQNETMLIPRLINSVKESKEIFINGKSGIKINPIYIDDAVKCVSNILKLKGDYIINIAGKEVMSLKEIVEVISKIVDKKPNVKYIKNSQQNLVADIEMMNKYLGEPTVTIEKGIKKMVSLK